ncbi:MAG: kinase, partial [Flavobacterium sp.]
TKHQGTLPMLDFYYEFSPGVWKPDNQRLMVYNNQYLFNWHVNRNIVRNERLDPREKLPVGYFTFFEGKWVFVNQKLEHMKDVSEGKDIPAGSMVELTNGKKILLSSQEGGRLALITITNNN